MDYKEILHKKTKRSIAIILSYKEKQCDRFLPQDISDGLRKVILDEINDVYTLALDLMSDDVIFNEDFLDKFNELYDKVVTKE